MVEDYDRLLELQAVAEDSAGLGAEQLARSQASLETSINKLTSSWQEFYTSFVKSTFFREGMNLINGLVSGLNRLGGAAKATSIVIAGFGASTGIKLFSKAVDSASSKILNFRKDFKGVIKDAILLNKTSLKSNTVIRAEIRELQNRAKAQQRVRTATTQQIASLTGLEEAEVSVMSTEQLKALVEEKNVEGQEKESALNAIRTLENEELALSNEKVVAAQIFKNEAEKQGIALDQAEIEAQVESIAGIEAETIATYGLAGAQFQQNSQQAKTVGNYLRLAVLTVLNTKLSKEERTTRLAAIRDALLQNEALKGLMSTKVAAILINLAHAASENIVKAALTATAVSALLVAAGVGAVSLARLQSAKATEEDTKATETAVEAYDDFNETLKDTRTLATKYNKARELMSKGVLRTTEQEEEYQQLLQEIQEIEPNLVNIIDEETLALNKNEDAWKAVLEAKEQQMNVDRELMDNAYLQATTQGVFEGTRASEEASNLRQFGQNWRSNTNTLIGYRGFDHINMGKLKGEGSLSDALSLMGQQGFSKDVINALVGSDLTDADFVNLMQVLSEGKKIQDDDIRKALGLEENQAEVIDQFVNAVDARSGNAITEYIKSFGEADYQEMLESYKRSNELDQLAAELGKTLNSEIRTTFASQNAVGDLEGIIEEYYNLPEATQNALTEMVQKAKNQNPDDFENFVVKSMPTFVKGTKVETALNDYFDKYEETLQESWDRIIKGNEETGDLGLADLLFGGDEDAAKEALKDLNLEQVQVLLNTIDNLGEEVNQAWFESWAKVKDQVLDDEELTQAFFTVDYSDYDSIINFQSLLQQKGLENTQVWEDFNDTIANSGDIANKSLKTFNQRLDEIKTKTEKLQSNFDNLAKSITGELDIAGLVDLITEIGDSSILDFSDFEATADGFKLQSASAEDVRQALLSKAEAEIQNQVSAYRSKIAALEQTDALKEQTIATYENAIAISNDSEAIEQYRVRINELKQDQTDLTGEIKQYAQQIDDLVSSEQLLGEVYEYLDKYSQKVVWEAQQKDIKEVADKLKEARDRLKELLELIEGINRTKVLEDMQEALELDKDDLQATIDLNINPIINQTAIKDTIQNINRQIAVQGALEEVNLDIVEQHRKVIESNQYMTINSQGIAQFTKDIQELYEKARNATSSEEHSAYKDIIDDIKNEIDSYNESVKAAKTAATEKKKLIKEQHELYKTILNKTASLERRILDILVANDQKELENYQAMIDKKKEALQDYLDAVQESIDKERNMRDLADQEEDLRRKERKLSILQMDTSGLYASDIASLQNEIASDRRGLEDTYVDNYIAKQQEEIDQLTESYDRDILAWEEYLNWKKEDMVQYQSDIDSIISEGVDSIVQFVMTNTEEVFEKTRSEIEELRITTEDSIIEEISYYNLLKEGGFDPVNEAIETMRDGTISVEDAIQNYTDTAIVQYGDLNSNITTVTSSLISQATIIEEDIAKAWNKAFEAAKLYATQAAYAAGEEPEFSSDGIVTNSTNGNTNSNKKGSSGSVYTKAQLAHDKMTWKGTNEYDIAFDRNSGTISKRASGHYDMGGSTIFSPLIYQDTNSKFTANWIARNGTENLYASQDGEKFTIIKDKAAGYTEMMKIWRKIDPGQVAHFNGRDWYVGKNKVNAYAKGGYIDYTGPAWVDGTPGQPEAILSAQDTRNFEQLRDILGNLMYNIQPGQNTATNNSYQDTYTIEVNVGMLGEDYTVDDLVDEIGDKIYNIATRNQTTHI